MSLRISRMARLGLLTAALVAAGSAMAQTAICYNCPTEWADWGTQLKAIKAKTGITVPADNKNSGQSLAQLVAEKASPVADVTYLGVTFAVQAQKDGVVEPYKPAAWKDIPDGLKDPAGHWFTIHSGTLGFMVNVDALKGKPVPKSWADLLKPEYKGDIQVANPASSGTAYTMIATLVQLMGEDKAFDYLKALHRNVGQYTRSGTGPIKAVARGETAVSISFVHDGPGEKMQGFPVETITPSDGTGAEIGSMSIVKGARNLDAAKKFYEWALTPAAQELGAANKQFQLPSNVNAKLDPRIPDFKKIKFINYDYAKYGASAERRRLIARWEKDVNSLPR